MKYADTGAREANPRIVILLVVLMAAYWRRGRGHRPRTPGHKRRRRP